MKQERINKEIERLQSIFGAIPEKKRYVIEGLIRRSAYMRATLEDYEADLDEGGYVELFTQSEKQEPYERERPVARLYNSMIRNYQTLMKQLTDLLPEEIKTDIKDEISEFLK
jgi:hypothetical protein